MYIYTFLQPHLTSSMLYYRIRGVQPGEHDNRLSLSVS